MALEVVNCLLILALEQSLCFSESAHFHLDDSSFAVALADAFADSDQVVVGDLSALAHADVVAASHVDGGAFKEVEERVGELQFALLELSEFAVDGIGHFHQVVAHLHVYFLGFTDQFLALLVDPSPVVLALARFVASIRHFMGSHTFLGQTLGVTQTGRLHCLEQVSVLLDEWRHGAAKFYVQLGQGLFVLVLD